MVYKYLESGKNYEIVTPKTIVIIMVMMMISMKICNS